jgi:hypothetical protein
MGTRSRRIDAPPKSARCRPGRSSTFLQLRDHQIQFHRAGRFPRDFVDRKRRLTAARHALDLRLRPHHSAPTCVLIQKASFSQTQLNPSAFPTTAHRRNPIGVQTTILSLCVASGFFCQCRPKFHQCPEQYLPAPDLQIALRHTRLPQTGILASQLTGYRPS